jgi:hypothetical protein
MAYTKFVLTALLILVQTSEGKTPARLDGLDRLYFQRVWEPGAALDVSEELGSLLPERIRESDFSAKPTIREEFFKVRDFRLPSESRGRKLWIRQVIDDRSYRMRDLWWALYDHGRRSDVWYFTPRIEGVEKILYNYEIDSVSTAGKGSVVFRVRGSMFRPGGHWMIVGKAFTFSVSEVGLTFSRVRNAFYLSNWPGSKDGTPLSDVSAERESRGRFEERTVTTKQEKTLRRRRFPDPLSDGKPKLWQELERVALCITQRPGAKRSTRAFDQPTFVERGGQPSK